MIRSLRLALGFLLLASCAGCGEPGVPRATRGYVLISAGGLGARHLGVYGDEAGATPFIDRLAADAAVFEHAFAPSPSTLVSQTSLWTGLEPPEHRVRPPLGLPSTALATLPERFAAHGFTTAGFSQGGYVSRVYGFDRGFDEFRDGFAGDGAGAAFARAADFLHRLRPGERFFLFLHARTPLPGPGVAATRLAGGVEASDSASLHARHVRRLDDLIAGLFAAIGSAGLEDQVTVVLTADHGEELGEHGRTGHAQVYPEVLRVPLIIVHPDLAGGVRRPRLARTVDVAATLYELARIPPAPRISGRSLVPDLLGRPRGGQRVAYAEAHGSAPQRSVLVERGEELLQWVESWLRGEPDGTWVSGGAAFDAEGPELAIRLVSYAVPRTLTVTVDGVETARLEAETRWRSAAIALPDGGRHRVALAADGCVSPLSQGNGSDLRCLSFKVRGIDLVRRELFDLTADPWASRDLSRLDPRAARDMAAILAGLHFQIAAPPSRLRPTPRVSEVLSSLGYLD